MLLLLMFFSVFMYNLQFTLNFFVSNPMFSFLSLSLSMYVYICLQVLLFIDNSGKFTMGGVFGQNKRIFLFPSVKSFESGGMKEEVEMEFQYVIFPPIVLMSDTE